MRTIAVLIATLMLSACTGMSTRSARAPLPPSEYEIDYARIATVERQARMNWGQVVWVSLPHKRVETPKPEQY